MKLTIPLETYDISRKRKRRLSKASYTRHHEHTNQDDPLSLKPMISSSLIPMTLMDGCCLKPKPHSKTANP